MQSGQKQVYKTYNALSFAKKIKFSAILFFLLLNLNACAVVGVAELKIKTKNFHFDIR